MNDRREVHTSASHSLHTGIDGNGNCRSFSEPLVDFTSSSSSLELYSLECDMVAGSTILANPKSQILREQSSFNRIFAGFYMHGHEWNQDREQQSSSSCCTYQVSMNYRGWVDVVQTGQHLIKKRLNVFRRQVLRRHYQFIQICVHIYKEEKIAR